MEINRPSDECMHALSEAHTRLIRSTAFNGPVGDPDAALDLVRAAALTLQAGDFQRVRRVMGLIANQATADAALLRLIREHFNAPSFNWEI